MASTIYPDWVLKYKTKGTELRHLNNKYYLYLVHCERIDGKNKKITDKYLGKITEDGLIPPKNKYTNIVSYEYGLSFFMFKYCINIYNGLMKTDKRVASKVFVIALFEYLYDSPFNSFLFESSYLSIILNDIDFTRNITDNMNMNINRCKRMINEYVLKAYTIHEFNYIKNTLMTLHIVSIDGKFILPKIDTCIKEIYNKHHIQMEKQNESE